MGTAKMRPKGVAVMGAAKMRSKGVSVWTIRNAVPDPNPGGLKRAKMKKKRSKKPDN
jgi:hypothetical protein